MRSCRAIFTDAQIRSLVEGRKTQHRLQIQLPHQNPLGQWEPTTVGGTGCFNRRGSEVPERAAIWHTPTGHVIACPYHDGDMLRVDRQLSLTITGVRVQRIADITDADCAAQGWPGFDHTFMDDASWFREQWLQHYGTNPWANRGADSPWVWALTFTREMT